MRDIPEKLENWIIDHLPKKRKKKTDTPAEQDTKTEKYLPTTDEKEKLKKIVQKHPDLIDWEYKEIGDGDIYKFQGHCPYQEEHTGESHQTNFSIFITDKNNVYASCWHSACGDSVKQLTKELNENWQDHKKLQKRDDALQSIEIIEDPIESNEVASIRDALKSQEFAKLIMSPAGSGKSYASATHFVEIIKTSAHVVYVAANTADMRQFKEDIELRTSQNINDLYIQELRGGYKLDEDGETEEDSTENHSISIADSTLGIITHQTYLKRKGISNLFYNLIAWIIKHRAGLIIDEVDAYCESQTMLIPMTARYKRFLPKGSQIAYYYRRNKCPGWKGRPACQDCHRSNNARYEVNLYCIPNFYQYPKLDETEFGNTDITLPEITTSKSPSGNSPGQSI